MPVVGFCAFVCKFRVIYFKARVLHNFRQETCGPTDLLSDQLARRSQEQQQWWKDIFKRKIKERFGARWAQASSSSSSSRVGYGVLLKSYLTSTFVFGLRQDQELQVDGAWVEGRRRRWPWPRLSFWPRPNELALIGGTNYCHKLLSKVRRVFRGQR